jgi:hypothetical protein
LRFARDYLDANKGLRDIIALADEASQSTGVSGTDYVALYRAVRKRKPKLVLECGTGKSTLVIAQAMADNVAGGATEGMKLVSMEHNRDWFEHSLFVIPERFKGFVEVRHSPVDSYGYSFVRGQAYRDVPEHAYEFVFVDGPPQAPDGEPTMCDMDFVRVVAASDTPVSAYIDNRKHTVLAYSLIFGPGKVKFYPELALGVVNDVTRRDMLLGDKMRMRATVFKTNVIRKAHADPV